MSELDGYLRFGALLAAIIGVSFAMTSKSRALKIVGYTCTALLMVGVCIAFVLASEDGAVAPRGAKVWGLAALAAAVWAGRNAYRAYRS